MKSLYEEMNGTYREVGDVKLPNLISTETNYHIGLWGQRYKDYLKENHRVLYYNLLTQGKLNLHLHDIDVRATELYERLVNQLAEKQGITEQLKADNQIMGTENEQYRKSSKKNDFR